MKKVIVIGASGSLARFVIESQKKHEDVKLTLFVRKKKRLHADSAGNCVVIEGDAMDFSSVKNAIAGQDIVYVNLAGNKDPSLHLNENLGISKPVNVAEHI